MKFSKVASIFVLAILLCSTETAMSALGEPSKDALRDKLISSVQKVKDIAREPNQTNGVASKVKQYFGPELDRPTGITFDFDSPEFADFVTDLTKLTKERENLGSLRRGELAAAVSELQSSYSDYKNSANPALTPGSNASNVSNTGGARSSNRGGGDDTGGTSLPFGEFLVPALYGLGGIVVIGLLGVPTLLLISLRRTVSDNFDTRLPGAFGGLKKRQDELSTQIVAFATVNKEINQQLSELRNDVRQVSRTLQVSQQTPRDGIRQGVPAGAGAAYGEQPPPRDGNAIVYPIAADEFLRRMQRKALVVKRDFQNDMLVADPEGKGELVLIRDTKIPDEIQTLLLVPRVTQLQMRQEYHNFYEKYYDCSKPESGAVWIVGPAEVEKVQGGWQLLEKGKLEIR